METHDGMHDLEQAWDDATNQGWEASDDVSNAEAHETSPDGLASAPPEAPSGETLEPASTPKEPLVPSADGDSAPTLADNLSPPGGHQSLADKSQEEDLALETLPQPGEFLPPQLDAATILPPSPPLATDPALRPRSLAETWQIAQAKRQRPVRLLLACIAGTGALIASTCLWRSYSSWTPPALAPPTLEALVGSLSVSHRDAWLQDVLAAKNETRVWDPTVSHAGLSAATVPGKAAAAASPRRSPPAPRAQAAGVAPARNPEPPALADADDTDPAYAAIFGSAERYQTASGRPSSQGRSRPSSSGKPQVSVRGVVMRAKLQDEVASDPAGAPVIAMLMRKAEVGGVVLPPGTEVHGAVSGNNDTRIFVDFQLARLADGSTLALQGTARDAAGRSGIPGKKLLTSRSAASIGVASVSRSVQQAGREFAGAAGSIVGAALEAATDSGAEKARRIDRDEYVVIVAPGTSFSVYLQSMEARDPASL